MLGRLTEEFNCLPSEAWRERERLPVGLLEEIIEARSYSRAKAMFDAATTPDARKALAKNTSPMVLLAKQITFEIVKEEEAAKKAEDAKKAKEAKTRAR